MVASEYEEYGGCLWAYATVYPGKEENQYITCMKRR